MQWAACNVQLATSHSGDNVAAGHWKMERGKIERLIFLNIWLNFCALRLNQVTCTDKNQIHNVGNCTRQAEKEMEQPPE